MTDSLTLKRIFSLATGTTGAAAAIADAASAAREIAQAYAEQPEPEFASEILRSAQSRAYTPSWPSPEFLLELATDGLTPLQIGAQLSISPARVLAILDAALELETAALASDAYWFAMELDAGAYTGAGAAIVHAQLARIRAETAAAWQFSEIEA